MKDNEWAAELHKLIDGRQLRETSRSPLSYRWVDDPYVIIPARDWVQYIRLRINAMPLRMRTARDLRRDNMPSRCRAGCQADKITAHIIQRCHMTHGGRILRHNAVIEANGKELSEIGYRVKLERRYPTQSGTRKPEMVVERDGKVSILDAQIISASQSLYKWHKHKCEKYAKNNGLIVCCR